MNSPMDTKKDYQDYVDNKTPNSPILKNCFNSFWIGGLICSIGQVIFSFCLYRGVNENSAGTIVSIILIGISAFLTGLNLFNKIGVGAKMFTVAGPVLVYGISTAIIVGIVYFIFNSQAVLV